MLDKYYVRYVSYHPSTIQIQTTLLQALKKIKNKRIFQIKLKSPFDGQLANIYTLKTFAQLIIQLNH